MNITLWIVAIVLAAAFAAAGVMKLTQSKDKLAASGMGWSESYSASAVKAIGAVEVLGAVGLILPAVVGVAPIVVPLAATGLALVMAGAIITHARRGETQPIVINVVLLTLAVFAAWGRFGPYAF